MTTKIILSPSKRYDVWYSNDGKSFVIHKRGFKTIDEAIKETTIINGSFKLLKDVLQQSK